MATRKQRATTSETYALDKDYNVVLNKGKKIHRDDKMFYIYKVKECYSTVSVLDYNTNESYKNAPELECWVFENRWKKIDLDL